MITVKRLKELLEKVPDDAMVWAYEGEKTGIGITTGSLREDSRSWFIVARDTEDEEDDDIEGFDDLDT